ncbi:MAG: hypothetical protein ABIO74_00445, partial [Dokdonella sp.]
HEHVFVVEQNRDSQLRSMLVNEFGIDPARLIPILHYDGTPITARFIASAINLQVTTSSASASDARRDGAGHPSRNIAPSGAPATLQRTHA